MTPERAFGYVVRSLRMSHGWSQETLAFEAQIHRTYLGRLERGECSPSLHMMFRVSSALNMPLAEIIRQVENVLSAPS